MKETPETRNVGIDALKLLSMFGVVLLHVVGGGIAVSSGLSRSVLSLLEAAAYCAVNCYAIISGYVGYTDVEKPRRSGKYALMWLQVAFYSVGLCLIEKLLPGSAIGWKTFGRSFLPVTTNAYWYFTSYTALFIMMPYLNALVRSLDQDRLRKMVLTLFVLFSCYALTARLFGDVFKLNKGYSFLWLAILYLIGAWMKKDIVPERISKRMALSLYAGSVLLTWLPWQIFQANGLYNYHSPLIVLEAFGLVVCFAKIRITGRAKRFIEDFVGASFGVYLIHAHGYIFKLIKSFALTFVQMPFIWMILASLGYTAAIFSVCLLIEKLRLILFEKIGINAAVKKVENRLKRAN